MINSYDGSLMFPEASTGAPVGRLLYGVAKGDRPAGATQRSTLCAEIAKNAMPLASDNRHQSRGRNPIHRHNGLPLHRNPGGGWLQTQGNCLRPAEWRQGIRHLCAAGGEQAGTLHKDPAEKWEHLRAQLPLQHGVNKPL